MRRHFSLNLRVKMKKFKTRKRYRLVFVNDNTLNTVWTMLLTRAKVWGLSALCVAAIAALVVCVVVWSPVSYLLPGYMRPEQRRSAVDNTLRVDSLLAAAEVQNAYLLNIVNLLCEHDSVNAVTPEAPAELDDTLMTATANERAFVESWLERERGTLSVLSPIVAEGMLFRSPVVGAVLADGSESELQASAGAPVLAIQDGIVVDVRTDAATGRSYVSVQHSNDFLSIVGGLADASVAPGRRVTSGQVLGRTASDGRLELNVWHQGRRMPLAPLLKL